MPAGSVVVAVAVHVTVQIPDDCGVKVAVKLDPLLDKVGVVAVTPDTVQLTVGVDKLRVAVWVWPQLSLWTFVPVVVEVVAVTLTELLMHLLAGAIALMLRVGAVWTV